jgi:cofilin
MDFKIKKAQRFYVYKIVDKKIIKIDYAGPRDATYDDLLEKLPENEPRYVLIDLDFKSKDGRPTSKLVFISWNPDTGSIRSKMLYSASKESIKNALPGVGIHINATDRAELDLDESIIPVAQSFTR